MQNYISFNFQTHPISIQKMRSGQALSLESQDDKGYGLELRTAQKLLQLLISCMSKKRTGQVSKDRSQHDDDDERIDDIPDEKVRILQDNLVFVNALPSDASSRDILMSPEYFPRYGTVTKLILNPPHSNKKGVVYQAYVTYSNRLDAALAIIALDGYKLSDRPLKVSFGTTKYCSHFLRGNDCPNPDCFYLHKIDKKREVSSGDTRTIFKEQNAKAMSYVLDNLQEIAGKILDSNIESIEEGFPSITETLDYLIDNDELLPKQLEIAYEKARSQRRCNLEVPRLENRVQSVTDPHEKQRQKDSHKLVKSNSHSTMCTPNKTQQIPPLTASKKKQQKIEPKLQVHQKETETVNKQNVVCTRELNIEQKIEKLIIKQIWKKNNSECKSRFIKGITTSREECSKLKGIVQKFLIAQN